jgi:hypothetical protein
LKKYIPLSFCFAFFACLFYYGAAFSIRQALGLSFALVLLGWNQLVPASKGRFRFTPYQVVCRPNVFLMLSDIGVVTSRDDFVSLFPRSNSPLPWAEDNLVHCGIYAVVLSHDVAESTEVVHFPWQNVYSTSLRWACRLTTIKHGLERIDFDWSPEIFMKPVIDGYEIGVTVNADWWQRQNDRKVKVLKEQEESHFGSVRLVLCMLPREVTSEFYRRVDYGLSRSRQAALQDAVEKKGWKMESTGSEIAYFGERYEHRYVEVWTRALELN